MESGVAVDTYWDLGMDDATAILFVQNCGRELHLIDYYEDSGEGLPYYVSILNEKAREHGYLYGMHVLPHDAKVREMGTGTSRLTTAKGLLGVDKVKVAKKPAKKEDAIEAARNIWGRVWIDEARCQHFLDAMHSYRKEYDEKHHTYKNHAVHDWSSHAADAFMVLAMGHEFSTLISVPRRAVQQRAAVGWT